MTAPQANQTHLIDSLVLSKRCVPESSCTYTYTLATLTGLALDQAETAMGPKVPQFTLLGYEFTKNSQPGIWFPGNKNHVVIQMTEAAMYDKKRALFQLSHEVFHTLSPTSNPVNVLEEGLATEFSLAFSKKMGIQIDASYISSEDYLHALVHVQCLRRYTTDVNTRLKNIRASGMQIHSIDAEKFKKSFPATPDNLIRYLTQPFKSHYNPVVPACMIQTNQVIK